MCWSQRSILLGLSSSVGLRDDCVKRPLSECVPLRIPLYPLTFRTPSGDRDELVPVPLFDGRAFDGRHFLKKASVGIRIDTGADISVLPSAVHAVLKLKPDSRFGQVVCRGLGTPPRPEIVYTVDFSIPGTDFPVLSEVPVIVKDRMPYAVLGIFRCLDRYDVQCALRSGFVSVV